MNCSLRKSGLFVSSLLMALVICSANVKAQTLYTNLGPGDTYDNTNGYYVDGSSYFNQVVADPFTLGAGATVGDAVLALGNYTGGNNPMTVYIESDNSGSPGSIITTLSQVGTLTPFGSGGSLITFDCSGPGCTLGAGSYWLVGSQTDAGTEDVWFYAYQDATGNIAYNQIGSPTGPWTSFDGTTDGFKIEGTSAPEPSAIALLMPGLLGIGYCLRRKLSV